MQEQQITFKADDGVSLHLYHWRGESTPPPRACVHIVHGMAEHAWRYRHLAARLCAAGYAVYASDLRGHGRTAIEGQHGHFAESDSWQRVVNDLRAMNQWLYTTVAPGIPLFMLGHSMGSFLSLHTVMDAGQGFLAGLVLSGSNAASPQLMTLARLIPWLEGKRQGWQGRSKLVAALSFGSFNQRFKPVRTDFDWLSRDPQQVDAYIADAHCGFDCSNRLWFDFLGGLAFINQFQNQARIAKKLPVLIMGGERDPVSAGGGLERLASQLRRAGLQQVELKRYPQARHEILNEINKDEVEAHILTWLEPLIPGGASAH